MACKCMKCKPRKTLTGCVFCSKEKEKPMFVCLDCLEQANKQLTEA